MAVSRLRRGRDRQAAGDNIVKNIGDPVKSLAGPDETDDLEMSGDDGIVPDLGESLPLCRAESKSWLRSVQD